MGILEGFSVDLLANALQKHGLDIVSTIVRNAVPGGAVIADVIGTIAEAVGVDPNIDDVVHRLDNATPMETTALTQAVDQRSQYWARMVEAEASAFESYHEVLAIDAKSPDRLQRLWRPINGVLFAVACFITILVVCAAVMLAVFAGKEIDLTGLTILIGLISPTVAAWAAVIGTYVVQRTKEKVAG